MQIIRLFTLFLFCSLPAQSTSAFSHPNMGMVKDLFADDYGNIYLYENKDFSFTKYDSLGVEKARLMLTLPFTIQSVQNPLTIPSFSENAQELRFFDQNLNEIQTVNLRQKFGFIKAAYVEDLQQVWLLDDSSKKLIQYNFREDRIVNSFPFRADIEQLIEVLVFDKKIYLLYNDQLLVYNLNAEQVAVYYLSHGRKLRRENENILIITKSKIQKIQNTGLETIFQNDGSEIVDKNSFSYIAIKNNKLYLYPINNKSD